MAPAQVESSYHPFVSALYRNTNYQFWILQLVGWFGFALLSFLSLTLWYNQQEPAYIAHTILQSAMGVLVSWPLRPLFHYFWYDKGIFRISAAIAGVLGCSIVWTILRITTFMAMTGETDLWADFGGWLFASILIFLAWVGFYHGIKYYQLLQSEHETLLKVASENKEQQLRRAKAETIAHEAQLKMLRYQLNPHFLFNTLNAISALVKIEEASKANAMVLQLSSFLRYSLDNDAFQSVPLDKEVDALRLYLNIEQTRFGDRLELEFDIDPEARSVLVPSLILQPLAENAIKHAIAQAVNGGKISIAANLENEHLIIRMADTGSGLASTSDSKPSGVGLRNTLDRLDEFYGDTYTFSLENSANGGLQVYMKLPLEKQPS
ncbi:MAG: histidine kinase [Porticoccaceae bacterium]|jgi:sensor histidine kinase YesM|nr:histidine kinase [Porticoccaceae bacterium]MBT7375820.1 histidine kinase [Porticoccaceae bacterium]